MMAMMERGSVIATTVITDDSSSTGSVCIKYDSGDLVKIGTIAIEEWDWSETKPIEGGNHDLVVLGEDENAYLKFGKKHLTSLTDYIKTLHEEQLHDIFIEWSESKAKIKNLQKELDDYQYSSPRY